MKIKNKKRAAKPETKYSTPDPLSATRNGKIARLDRDTRESLNRRLKENHSTEDILDWLNAAPEVKAVLDKRFKGQPITHQNLSQWRMRGYREWANQQCAYAELEKKQREITEKGGNPYQLGYEMTQIHAAEYLATLSDLLVTAPNAEARMKQLSKAMMEFRGWRRADYQAERMALEQEKWRWQCQSEIDAAEKEEEDTERRKIIRWLIRFVKRAGHRRPWTDDLLDSADDLDLLNRLQKKAWKIEEEIEAEKAAGKSPESKVQSPEPGEGPQSADLAEGKKPVVDNQGLADSGAVQRSAENKKPVSDMSDAERKAFYAKYLVMLQDLNAAGVDLREIEGYADAEREHAKLKICPESGVQSQPNAEQAEANIQQPTSNIQHPESGEETPNTKNQTPKNLQISNINAEQEERRALLCESENANAQSDALRSDAGGEAALPESANLQPSTCNLKPQAEGSMTIEQAEKVVEEWRGKAGSVGIFPPGPGSFDYASLKAYLSGEPAPWYNLNMGKAAVAEPPSIDPRRDPTSRWYPIAEKWELFKRAGKVL